MTFLSFSEHFVLILKLKMRDICQKASFIHYKSYGHGQSIMSKAIFPTRMIRTGALTKPHPIKIPWIELRGEGLLYNSHKADPPSVEGQYVLIVFCILY